MNLKNWIPLVLAVVLGGIALVVAKRVLHPGSGKALPSNLTDVVVTTHGVDPGQELTANDLMIIKLPSGHIPEQSFHSISDLIGRAPVGELVKDETVVEPLLSPAGSGTGMQALVPPGMRAITIEVNEFSGLAGMLLPGSRVDVVANVRNEHSDSVMARTILQDIKVAAIGRQLTATPAAQPAGTPPPPPSNSVTLVVTPKQAQALQLASQGSRPWLVLRSLRDTDTIEATGTSMAELSGLDQVRAAIVPVMDQTPTTQPTTQPAEPRKTMRLVQIIDGGTIKEVQVPLSQTDLPEAPAMPRPQVQPTQQPQPVMTDSGTPVGNDQASTVQTPDDLDAAPSDEPSDPEPGSAVSGGTDQLEVK